MIEGKLKRGNRDITFGDAWRDEVNPKAIREMVTGMFKDLLWKTQPPISPGVTSDRARTYQSSGGGGSVSGFDEVNESKKNKSRKRRDVDNE